jgi:hypothetical protein
MHTRYDVILGVTFALLVGAAIFLAALIIG